MAHFLEHLVFKGGEKYPTYKDVNETAERLGGVLNAYTSHDLVAFHITVRAESAAGGDRPADRLRRAPAPGRRGARPRARRRDPGDQPRLRPAVDGRRVPDRQGRVRRAPAGADGARPGGEPAGASRARAIVAFRERRWAGAQRRRVPRRQPRPSAGARRSCTSASPLPRPARRPSRMRPRRTFAPKILVEERDTNQSHLRMIYRPEIAGLRRARARGAVDLLDAARRVDGLAAVRGDPREARPVLLGLRDRPRLRRRADPAARARAWSRPSASRPTRACARSSTSCARTAPPRRRCERARAYAAGRLVLAFENTNAVARHAANQQIVFGEDIDPDAAIAALDAVTFDEVREVAAGIADEPRRRVRGAARGRGVLGAELARASRRGGSSPAISRTHRLASSRSRDARLDHRFDVHPVARPVEHRLEDGERGAVEHGDRRPSKGTRRTCCCDVIVKGQDAQEEVDRACAPTTASPGRRVRSLQALATELDPLGSAASTSFARSGPTKTLTSRSLVPRGSSVQ